jgi:hypothetical protein
VDALDGARWEWLVTASKAGKYRLLVEAMVEVGDGPTKDVHRFFSYSQELTVEVPPGAWLADHWQWILGTLVIPLLVAAWKWWRKRRTPPAGALRC